VAKNEYPEFEIVCISTADWDTPLWTNKQHMMNGLNAKGSKVLYINSIGLRSPGLNSRDLLRIFKRVTAWRPYAKERSHNLWIDAPLVLPMSNTLFRFLNKLLLRFRLSRNLKRLGFSKPIIWTYHPYADTYLRSLDRYPLVYHCVDNLADYPGVDSDAYVSTEKIFIKHAIKVMVSSKPLIELMKNRGAKDPIYWPNPANVRTAAINPSQFDTKKLVVGFIGAINEEKLNFPLISEIAEKNPKVEFHFYGPLGDGLKSSKYKIDTLPKNIVFKGHISFESIPEILQTFTFAWIPYSINPYTKYVFPMKVYEYYGQGLMVVSTELPSLIEQEIPLLNFFSSSSDFEKIFLRFNASDDEVKSNEAKIRITHATKHSWENRIDEAISLLEEISK
jgi:hypothetical protein